MYKEASRLKLRFQTNKGILSMEQLWDLSIPELDELTIRLESEYKDSGKKSFVVKRTEKDKIAKMKFDISLDILNTKVEEDSLALEAKENKAHNEKIIALIAEKQDESLKEKSIKDLEKMLR